jgi:hypothetical protein
MPTRAGAPGRDRRDGEEEEEEEERRAHSKLFSPKHRRSSMSIP